MLRSLARQHLAGGHDVVLPQLTVLPEVVDELSRMARDAGADFLEVVLVASPADLRSRLVFVPRDDAHPRAAFTTDELVDQGRHAVAALEALASLRADATLVEVSGDLETAVSAVRAAIA